MNANNHPTLANLRLATACMLAYSRFLCFDELIHVRASNLHIVSDMMKIKISHSKMDSELTLLCRPPPRLGIQV